MSDVCLKPEENLGKSGRENIVNTCGARPDFSGSEPNHRTVHMYFDAFVMTERLSKITQFVKLTSDHVVNNVFENVTIVIIV